MNPRPSSALSLPFRPPVRLLVTVHHTNVGIRDIEFSANKLYCLATKKERKFFAIFFINNQTFEIFESDYPFVLQRIHFAIDPGPE
jgi:hypothetical protein